MRKTGHIKNFLVTGFFLVQGFLLSAQHITITLDKDTIAFNETAVLTLKGEAKDITGLANLQETDGIIVTRETKDWSMNNSTGNIKFTQTFTLAAYKAGTFSLGPAWIQTGGNRIFSNKLNIVVKTSSSSDRTNEIAMICVPDKKKAVVGEQITVTLLVYTRLGISGGITRPMAHTFNGFWYHEGIYPEALKDSTATINGTVYKINKVYREFVFPNSSGKLEIPRYVYECQMNQIPVLTGDPFTDEIMMFPVPVIVVSEEVPIEVSPLPEKNKPANFAGDIGEFSLGATIDKEKIKVNEAVKLTVTISGTGNINFIQLPKINFPDGIESYSTVSNDNTTIGKDGLEGEKTFTVTLIPQKEGNYILPEISFSYYDPKKKKYVTVQTPEIKLNVAPGDPSENVSENNLPETFLDGRSYGKTIRRILLIVIPAILLTLLIYYRSRKKKEKSEIATAKNNVVEIAELNREPVKSKPDINSMMQVAERFIMNGSIQSGIAQLYETLLSAILFKTELSREEASIHQLRYRLGIKNLSPEMVNETINVLEELASQRYGNWESDRSKLSENLRKTQKLALELLS